MGLAILVLFLAAWLVVLGGPMVARALRNRRDDDPIDGFGSFDRAGRRARAGRRRLGGWRPGPGPVDDAEHPILRVPLASAPVEPEIVKIRPQGGRVPGEIRRRRALLALICGAGALLLLAVATGSLVLWILQIGFDVVLGVYAFALGRHGREPTSAPRAKSGAPDPDHTTLLSDAFWSGGDRRKGAGDDEAALPRAHRGPPRRVVVPVAAVIAVGCIVFGSVALLGGRGGRSESAADSRFDESVDTRPRSATSTTRAVTTTVATTLPATTLPPPTLPVTTVASTPQATRPTFPARPLPPVTQPPVLPVLEPPPPAPPPPPPTTQPPSLLCLLLHLC